MSPLLMARSLNKPASASSASAGDLHANALRPTRAWYFLLAGLLTRSALEGYMTGGWRGIEPLEVLLCVGLGLPPKTGPASPRKDKGAARDEGDPFAEFDPDDLPELEDAVKILFPSLREINPADSTLRATVQVRFTPLDDLNATSFELNNALNVSRIVDGNRRFDVVVRLQDERRTTQGLADLLIESPVGWIPVRQIADIVETDGPNQILRENGKRRVVVMANTDGAALPSWSLVLAWR